uniref:Uncharacterized protein n=1 Tax=Anguilla anguilla TaxID=7936 RepID=A0A0E9VF37_ANGAN
MQATQSLTAEYLNESVTVTVCCM